jgi:hypothetical protein
MESALEKITKQTLRIDQFNWKNLVNHPSEFVRLDERLRLKQLELGDFNEFISGYNPVAAQEHLEHQRLLFSMRCYLVITGYNLFRLPIISEREQQSLKESFTDRENYIADLKNFIELSDNENEFWLIMQTTSDKSNTQKFFKRIMSEVLSFFQIDYDDREKMMKLIIERCRFTIP